MRFNSPIDDEDIPAALSLAWPYMRGKLVEQLQSHDIPAMSVNSAIVDCRVARAIPIELT